MSHSREQSKNTQSISFSSLNSDKTPDFMLSPKKEAPTRGTLNSPEMCLEDLIMTSNEILRWHVKDVVKMLQEFRASGPTDGDLQEVIKEVKSWSMGETIQS